MKKILVVLLAIALLATPVIGADTAPNDFTSVYDSKKGLVSFNHTVHSAEYECATCHEGEEGLILVDKSYGHKTCKSCHKAIGADFPNAPVRCNGCHVK
jgi:hypothetical protein